MGYFKICAATFFFSVKLRFFAFIFGVRRAFCICRGTVRIFGIKRCAVLRCCGCFALFFIIYHKSTAKSSGISKYVPLWVVKESDRGLLAKMCVWMYYYDIKPLFFI